MSFYICRQYATAWLWLLRHICRQSLLALSAGKQNKLLIAPHPLHRGALASLGLLEKAGLLTLSHPQAPSHPLRGSGFLPGAIMELTAARQSGTHTPFPLLIAWSEPFECKDNAICPFCKNIRHFFRFFCWWKPYRECPLSRRGGSCARSSPIARCWMRTTSRLFWCEWKWFEHVGRCFLCTLHSGFKFFL